MSAPSPVVRAVTYERDGHRCVSCGSFGPLQYQHRAAEGMGGRLAVPRLDEGLTSCAICNPAYEDGMQALALVRGWKVRRFVVEQGIAYRVPVLYVPERTWFVVSTDGKRSPILRARVDGLMTEVYGEHSWAEMKERAA